MYGDWLKPSTEASNSQMKFAVQINSSPFQTQSGATAYQFTKAALALGHEIIRVFFYRDGAYHGLATRPSPDDENHPAHDWSELARNHGVDLVICISAAQRRGLPVEADHDDGNAARLSEGFRIAGLGLWVDACLKADRFIVF
jgi:tRNA 2-thiouridine synthesizing protein D